MEKDSVSGVFSAIKKQLDLSNTRLQIDDETVLEIYFRIHDHHHETGSGIPASVLAKEVCGHEDFHEVITFTVEKYLSETIEAVPGIGFCLRGKERKRNSYTPSPEYIGKVRKYVSSIFDRGFNYISIKSLILRAAMDDIIIMDVYELPNEKLFKNAVEMLSLNAYSPFELVKGEGLKRRALQN